MNIIYGIRMNRISLVAAFLSGIIYLSVEVIFRALTHSMPGHPYGALFGYTSLHMIWVGALTVYFMGRIADGEPSRSFAWFIKVIKAVCVGLIIEFTTGMILNKWLGFWIWDYSDLPGNIYGQICPQFALAWLFIAPFALWLDETIINSRKDAKNLLSFYYRTFFWWI